MFNTTYTFNDENQADTKLIIFNFAPCCSCSSEFHYYINNKMDLQTAILLHLTGQYVDLILKFTLALQHYVIWLVYVAIPAPLATNIIQNNLLTSQNFAYLTQNFENNLEQLADKTSTFILS